jgi:hypothetical protein
VKTSELSRRAWDKLSKRDCARLAKQIKLELLPEHIEFSEVRTCRSVAGLRRNAIFSFGNAEFVFIPGATVVLGYDRRRPFKPSREQAANWRKLEEEYEVQLKDHLNNSLTQLRRVAVAPFLLERTAHHAGRTPVAPGAKPTGEGAIHRVSATEIYREVQVSRQMAADFAAQDGFRMPSSDEWEYACGAGTRTMFWWGDDCPCDSDPLDAPPLPSRKHGHPFDLRIAVNPYEWEATSDWPVMRGGDGGCMICGGMASFASWLTLATAFFDKASHRDAHFGVHVRRALSLSLEIKRGAK